MTAAWWRTDAVEWHSHGWSIDLRGDEVADIRHHGTVLLRAVRAVVRGRDWQTVPTSVKDVRVDGAALMLSLQHRGYGAMVTSTLAVRADVDTLSLQWDAVSESCFETCRIGLVALHPPSDAGRHVEVVHSDGSMEHTRFPIGISPHQPIRDIRELRLDAGATIAFDGDVFEMEDQRNWTDASFKTYSRPLELPYPYTVTSGEVVSQAITLTVTGAAPLDARPDPVLRIDLVSGGDFPDIGVEASTAPDPVPVSKIGDFRVVELDLRTSSWRAALGRAASDGLPLDVRVVSDGDPEPAAAAAVALVGLPVIRIAAFDSETHITTPEVAALVRDALAAARVAPSFLGGARSHFTELNREQHVVPRSVDAITFTTTPLFHATDTEQLIESIPMQRLVAEQAVSIADGLDVHIGPVSLRPRFNNVTTVPDPLPKRSDLTDGYGAEFTGADDPRQSSAELAAWVIASAAAFTVPGVRSLSWFETWGSRGLADPAGRTPAADAIDALTDLSGAEMLFGASPDGFVWAIAGRREATTTVLAANLSRADRAVDISVVGAGTERVLLSAGGWKRIVISDG